MNESHVVELKAPAVDTLSELLKEGARQLLAQAIEAEVAELLAQYAGQTVDGKRAVVRNGYLPERSLQTGLGDVPVKVPKVRLNTLPGAQDGQRAEQGAEVGTTEGQGSFARDLDGRDPRECLQGLRSLCEALRGQVPEGDGVPGEGQGRDAGVLRLPGGALACLLYTSDAADDA